MLLTLDLLDKRAVVARADVCVACTLLEEVPVELDLLEVPILAVDVAGDDHSAWGEHRARATTPQALVRAQLIDDGFEQAWTTDR